MSAPKTTDLRMQLDPRDRSNFFIVGISGVTCGGKTTLSHQLLQSVTPKPLVMHQDHYFLQDDNPRHVKCEGMDHNNYDILSALDMDQMYSDALSLIRGESPDCLCSCEAPSFNSQSLAIKKRLLILEGFTILNYKPLADLCDLKYYVVLSHGECASRRALRVYSPPDVPHYFEKCVWIEHQRYKAEVERDPSVLFLDGRCPDNYSRAINDIREHNK